MDYRKFLFDRYRTAQGWGTIDLKAADRWTKPYDTWLRGWFPVSRDARILDVGCGPGFLLRYLGQRGYTQLSGVDLSPEQISAARQYCSDVTLGNAIDYLQLRPASFDLILAIDIIEHLRKDEVLEFLTAAHSALAPGGRLIVQTPNCASPWGIVQRHSDFTHEVGLTPGALAWLLRLMGFVNYECRETGPIIRGAKSLVRWVLWKMLRACWSAYDLIETGSVAGIYTRVFISSAIKPVTNTVPEQPGRPDAMPDAAAAINR